MYKLRVGLLYAAVAAATLINLTGYQCEPDPQPTECGTAGAIK